MRSIKPNLVKTWFTKNQAILNIDSQVDEKGVLEYLSFLIDEGYLHIPEFTFKAYNCSELAPGRIVHNFYYELSNRTLTGAQINSILAECPLLFDDGSQPNPCLYRLSGFIIHYPYCRSLIANYVTPKPMPI